jgi:two-component SAPR family response regulator
VDVHQELARLLKKSSLKKRFVFTRIGESLDAIHLLRRLQTQLLIINENLSDDEIPRYFEICRAVQPGIKILYLSPPPRSLPGDPVFSRSTRFVPKPISISRIEASVGELM